MKVSAINRYIKLLSFAAIICLLVISCQNDGNIGPIFGTWRVDSAVKEPGISLDCKGTTFSFQGNIVEVVRLLDDMGSHIPAYGNYSRDGNTITLNFTNHDNDIESGTSFYAAPSWLGMTSEQPMTMQCTIDDREMVWIWIAADGLTYTYKLHKTW